MPKATAEQNRQLEKLNREYEERKAKILTPKLKKPPITEPTNPAWTVELIDLLKSYIDAGRYFRVVYGDSPVFGMDLVPEEHTGDFAPDDAEFYLEEYDDARPEGIALQDCVPDDFKVFLFKPVAWQNGKPNWSEADPETWAEYEAHMKDQKE